MHRNPLEVLEPRTLLSAVLPKPPPTDPGVHIVGHTCYVNGTAGKDFITIIPAPKDAKGKDRPTQVQVQVNGMQPVFQPGNMKRFVLHGMAGDDNIRIDSALPASFHPRVIVVHGDDGNDTITGSVRPDRLFGDAGDDTIVGFNGNDEIHGGAGNDRLDGGYGNDTLFGEDGNDTLIGGPGGDGLFGGVGDDTFLNNESAADRATGGRDVLNGGGGNDRAQTDAADHYRLVTGGLP